VPVVFDLVHEQVVVAAPEQRRPERAHQRQRIRRIVDRAQRREKIAYLAAAVHQRARLRAVRHVCVVERPLEER
jgi:hypothetical protein